MSTAGDPQADPTAVAEFVWSPIHPSIVMWPRLLTFHTYFAPQLLLLLAFVLIRTLGGSALNLRGLPVGEAKDAPLIGFWLVCKYPPSLGESFIASSRAFTLQTPTNINSIRAVHECWLAACSLLQLQRTCLWLHLNGFFSSVYCFTLQSPLVMQLYVSLINPLPSRLR